MKQTRKTVAKTEILNLIQGSEVALSHTDIQKSVGSLCDRVTIYRVLARLEAEGKIHKVIDIDGGVKYARCHKCDTRHEHNHLHFSCEKCLKVSCLEGVKPVFQLPKSYKVHETNFTVSGICANCS